jgi:hypothetical protein
MLKQTTAMVTRLAVVTTEAHCPLCAGLFYFDANNAPSSFCYRNKPEYIMIEMCPTCAKRVGDFIGSIATVEAHK